MDNVRIFEGNEIEVFELNEKILFNPRDVGKCLEISADGVRKAVTRMNKSQVIKLTNSDVTNCHIRKLNNAGENFLSNRVFTSLFLRAVSHLQKGFPTG